MKQLRETVGIALIGDGVVGALIPQRHIARWKTGPQLWQRTLAPFAGHPERTRIAAIAELAAGLWLTLRR